MKKLKVCWMSAGVSSFIAAYLAENVDMYIYIDIADQHEDSMATITRTIKRIIRIRRYKYNAKEKTPYTKRDKSTV